MEDLLRGLSRGKASLPPSSARRFSDTPKETGTFPAEHPSLSASASAELAQDFRRIAAACLSAVAMAPLRNSTPMEVWEAYLGELYRRCADPQDLLQRILVEEITWAHQAIAGLLARAAAGSGHEAAGCAAAACRLLGEVRRLVLTVEASKHSAQAGLPGELRESLETPARSKRVA